MENREKLNNRRKYSKERMEHSSEYDASVLDSSWSVNPLYDTKQTILTEEDTKLDNLSHITTQLSISEDNKDAESESGFYESDSTASVISKRSRSDSLSAVPPDEGNIQGADNRICQIHKQGNVDVEQFNSRLVKDILTDQTFVDLEQELARDLGLPATNEDYYGCDCNSNKATSLINTCNLTSSRRCSLTENDSITSESSCPSTVIFKREQDRYKVFKVINNQVYRLANDGFTEVFDLETVSSFSGSFTEVSDETGDDCSSIDCSEDTFSLEELAKELNISLEDLPEMKRAGLWISSQYERSDTVAGLTESQAQIVSARGTVRGVKNRVRNNIKHLLAASSGLERHGIDHDIPHPEQGIVVIYTTGLRLIRSTNLECHYVKKVFHNLMVQVDERDILMNPLYKNELEQRLGTTKYTLPQVFINGKLIGGAQEIERLVETGQIKEHLQNTVKWDTSRKCQRCGGYRYVTCLKCSGSGKSRRTRISREINQLRCSACRDGLIKCPDCDVTALIVNGDSTDPSE